MKTNQTYKKVHVSYWIVYHLTMGKCQGHNCYHKEVLKYEQN